MNNRLSVILGSLPLLASFVMPMAWAQDAGTPAADSESAQSEKATDNPTVTLAPSAIISRDVLVGEGDSLRSIARRELGRSGFAPQLAEFNGLVANAPLIPGNIIRIPIHVPARGEFASVVFVKGDATLSRLDEPSSVDAAMLATAAQNPPAAANPAPGPTVAANVDSNSAAAQRTVLAISRNTEILSGDTILTGDDGFVSIQFSSGSVVNLQPDTEAVLSRLNCLPADDSCVIEIKTLQGKVTSDIEARDDQPVDFRISTPYASAAVRGTVFDVDVQDLLLVGVTEGNVDLSAQQQNVELPAGFGSVVQEGQPPSEPVALLPPPVFKRVPSRVAPGDAVTWWPFSDAASYGAQVTNDEDGNETLASFTVNQDRIGFDSIESGDYFLQLRAIDSNGLQGFTSNTRITIAEIDDSVTPVDTTVVRQGSEFLVTVQDPPLEVTGYEIQIANNEDFEDPLSVDVNANGSAIFQLDNDLVYTRARILLDPFTVSAYGEVASSEQ